MAQGKRGLHRLRRLEQRWGIPINGTADFMAFRSRAEGLLNNAGIPRALKADHSDARFDLITGQKPYATLGSLGIVYYLSSCSTFAEFMVTLQKAFWAMNEAGSQQIETFLETIKLAKDMSPGVEFAVVRRGRIVTFYPPGAKELDVPLVEETLVWLDEFPTVAQHFEEALKIILARDAAKYRNVFDNLRWALEQLLRSVLGNRKPLEKQREHLLPWLAKHGVHQQVTNMYVDLLNRFTEYQNAAVKHGEEWSASELEFVVYMTGSFMRLVLSLNNAYDLI